MFDPQTTVDIALPTVSLVIPVRNGSRTLRACLESVVPRLADRSVCEIIVVDDGSTDDTRNIAESFDGVTVVVGQGRGAAVARNLGVKHASGELIWFLDADCVAEPDALSTLLRHFADDNVAGAGGTYTNGCPESLLATLIHEEIVARHRTMPSNVNHLATYDVVYRRDLFVELGGFDPGSFWAHDVEFAYRVVDAGHKLRFDHGSRVSHYHPTKLGSYLYKQAKQGYYRMRLYSLHPDGRGGDSYTKWYDIAQPVLACTFVALHVLVIIPPLRILAVMFIVLTNLLLLIACVPMGIRLVRETGDARMIFHVALSYVRSFFRAAGMVCGLVRFGTSMDARQPSAEETVA